MQILKVIGLILNYPQQEVQEHRTELLMAISCATEIPPDMRADLSDAVNSLFSGNIMDSQENYGLLFDQGRSMSLHLFEHVHGESRDRGQAMVDLMNVYQGHGFEINQRELPDFIPLFLEYLATRPDIEAREWLADVSHIIASLCARLYERGNGVDSFATHYAKMLESILIIAGATQQLEEVRPQVAKEVADNTPEAIDQEWEETAVTFGAGSDEACGLDRKPSGGGAQALHWVDAAAKSTNQQSQTEGYTS